MCILKQFMWTRRRLFSKPGQTLFHKSPQIFSSKSKISYETEFFVKTKFPEKSLLDTWIAALTNSLRFWVNLWDEISQPKLLQNFRHLVEIWSPEKSLLTRDRQFWQPCRKLFPKSAESFFVYCSKRFTKPEKFCDVKSFTGRLKCTFNKSAKTLSPKLSNFFFSMFESFLKQENFPEKKTVSW